VLYSGHPAACHSEFVVRWLPATVPTSATDSPDPSEQGGPSKQRAQPDDVRSGSIDRRRSRSGDAPATSAHDLGSQDQAALVPPCAAEDLVEVREHKEAQQGCASSQVLDWPDLIATLRVATQVRKRLLLLYLHQPPAAEMRTPGCITSFKVRSRWSLRTCCALNSACAVSVHRLTSLEPQFWHQGSQVHQELQLCLRH
jgi:tRNA intron endonuclease, catalytic C-terminal domain